MKKTVKRRKFVVTDGKNRWLVYGDFENERDAMKEALERINTKEHFIELYIFEVKHEWKWVVEIC